MAHPPGDLSQDPLHLKHPCPGSKDVGRLGALRLAVSMPRIQVVLPHVWATRLKGPLLGVLDLRFRVEDLWAIWAPRFVLSAPPVRGSPNQRTWRSC